MVGCIQQFVCPYIVSGLNVAATKVTFLPESELEERKRKRVSLCIQ